MNASDSFTPAAYDCIGCGRAMRVLTSPELPADRVCNLCRFIPGWHRMPAVLAAVGHRQEPRSAASRANQNYGSLGGEA